MASGGESFESCLRKSAEISISVRLLALRQFSDHQIPVLAERVIASTGIGQSNCGEVMPAVEVPSQFAVRLLPSSIGCRGRRDARRQPEAMQEAVRVQRGQVALVELGLLLEGSVKEPYLSHPERLNC